MSAPENKHNYFKIILLVIIVTIATVWISNTYLFPHAFTPVVLGHKEKAILDKKIQNLDSELQTETPVRNKTSTTSPPLTPEKYSEEFAKHEITFTEREINALIATNTDLASKLAVDLSEGMVSAKLLMPLDPDMPFFGGKTLRMAAGAELHYKNGKPVVVLKGVSLWGVALPNSWLGNLKNVDLVHEFGDAGFWKAFADGVENISVGDETLTIKLKE